MEDGLAARATAAALSLAEGCGLPVDHAVVVQSSNALALRLLPGDVFARAAPVGQEVAAFEVRVAQDLAAAEAPIAALDPRVAPRVYELDGFAVTFWRFYPSVSTPGPAHEYAGALRRLHAAMRSTEIDAPHVTERVAEAERLLTHRQDTPELADEDRSLLLDTLRSARRGVLGGRYLHQVLHGEPHPGNLLRTTGGPLFVDLETCCRGPVEFDVAHVPAEVAHHYPGLDQVLLQECRRLVLALVATWRWDVRDEFPDGRRHGLDILALLRQGPPWPALGPLSTG